MTRITLNDAEATRTLSTEELKDLQGGQYQFNFWTGRYQWVPQFRFTPHRYMNGYGAMLNQGAFGSPLFAMQSHTFAGMALNDQRHAAGIARIRA